MSGIRTEQRISCRPPDAEDLARERLEQGGVLTPGAPLVPLDGGVSCNVWRIAPESVGPRFSSVSPDGLVAKTPLSRMRVAAEWVADTERGIAEADALELFSHVTPGRVPQPVWRSWEPPVLVMPCAPLDWRELRGRLMQLPDFEPDTEQSWMQRLGVILGTTLATWHSSVPASSVAGILRNAGRLRILRTDPYYRHAGEQRTKWRPVLYELADQLEESRECLVHGDFSPKNILTGPSTYEGAEALWILDAEAAHVGTPLLDVAFFVSHLTLKAVRRPALAARYRRLSDAFLDSYKLRGPSLSEPDLARHLGAIVAGRICGKSPVSYLDEEHVVRAEGLADRLLCNELSVRDTWDELSSTP